LWPSSPPALTSDSECVICLAVTVVKAVGLLLEVWITTAEVGPFGVVVMGRGQEGQTDHSLTFRHRASSL